MWRAGLVVTCAVILAGCAGPMQTAVAGGGPAPAGCAEQVHATFPAFGASMAQVDQLPRLIESHAVEAPEIAREAGVDGTVIVNALVCEHGRVVKTRVQKSIPMLDRAAIDAIERYTYQPALSHGQPTSCWLADTVRFGPYQAR